MIRKMITGALFAGFAAGLLGALLHFAFVQEYILLGETYETGEVVHFGGSGSSEAVIDQSTADAASHDSHAHDHEDGGDAGTFQRNALTVLFTCLIYVGYGLFMSVAFQVAEMFNRPIRAQDGILWGIAGYTAFQLAPAMGLPPELPGTIAAEISARQVWWFSTVGATIAGLALLAFGRSVVTVALAAALLAAPHAIGAPHPDGFWGVAPPEVGAAFSARVLGVGLAVWAVLGWLSARFWTEAEK